MLSVLYVLYSLFSHYLYGPAAEEVDELPAEEKRELKSKTQAEKKADDGNVSINKIVAELTDVAQQDVEEAYFDHGDNDSVEVERSEIQCNGGDEVGELVVDVGVKPIDYSQLYEGKGDVAKSAPKVEHSSARKPHFVMLEEDSEDDEMIAEFGVVSVTSKYKIEEPPKRERIPFTQTIWAAPEPEEVEPEEIEPEEVVPDEVVPEEVVPEEVVPEEVVPEEIEPEEIVPEEVVPEEIEPEEVVPKEVVPEEVEPEEVEPEEVEPEEVEPEEVEPEEVVPEEVETKDVEPEEVDVEEFDVEPEEVPDVDDNNVTSEEIIVEALTVDPVSCEAVYSPAPPHIQQDNIEPVKHVLQDLQTPPKRKLDSPEEEPSPKRKVEEAALPKRKLESQKSYEISDFDKKMSKESYLELSTEGTSPLNRGSTLPDNKASAGSFSLDIGRSIFSGNNGTLTFNGDTGAEASVFSRSSSVASSYVTADATSDNTYSGVNGSNNAAAAAAPADDPFIEPQKSEIRKYVPKPRVYEVKSDAEWNMFFETSMLTGRREAILDGLKECFKTATHPYMLCCDLLITFGITHASGRSIFQRAALKQLTVWRTKSELKPSLSDQLKALEVSYLCNHTHFESLFRVFELEATSTEEAVAFIRDKLDHKKKKYIKHMAFLVTELSLQGHFDTADMLFPLLALDKMMTIEAYLSTQQLQTEFIGHLDALLSPSTDKLRTLIDTLTTDFGFDESSSQFQFTTDQITTLVKRFLKKYKVAPESAPNLSESKTISNLKNLLFCKYKKGSKEDWTHAITDAVRNSEMLQASLLTELVKYNDVPYAASIVESLQIKSALVPAKIQSYIDSSKPKAAPLAPDTYVFDKPDVSWSSFIDEKENQAPELEEEEIVMPELVHPEADLGFLALPSSVQIVDVTNAAQLQQCSKLLRASPVVGLDSEWRAVLDPTQATPVALLQLACSQCVFLLDIPALLCNVSEVELLQFAEEVFRRCTIVGYAVEQDVLKLHQTVPALGDVLATACMVDLATAHKHITREENEARSAGIREAISQGLPLPPRAAVQYTGLAKLCGSILSAPLDKTCQISDWVRRPLTTAQRQYAALDAYVLLSLYDKLTARFQPVPLTDLHEVLPSSFTDDCPELYEAPKNESPVASPSLKVVADVPLQGLGKKLRHIGVDCVILASGQDVDHAAKVSLMEGRIILSKDSNAERLAKLTDPGRVYSVTSKDATTQLAEIIKHFNLTVCDTDLFSRCAMCNCADFVKISTEQAGQIKALSETANSSTTEFSAPVYRRRVQAVSSVNVTMVGVTQYGVKLQLNKVKNKKLHEVDEFWGCYDCGKMYWDGCHLKNFKDKHLL